MELVKVQKAELRAVVQVNRDGHRNEFLKALEGFKARAIDELERRIVDVEKGRKFSQHLGLPEPEDHTKDYDRVLKMLAMSVDDVIELDESDFQMYVMDDWAWKQQFTTTNSMYVGYGSSKSKPKK